MLPFLHQITSSRNLPLSEPSKFLPLYYRLTPSLHQLNRGILEPHPRDFPGSAAVLRGNQKTGGGPDDGVDGGGLFGGDGPFGGGGGGGGGGGNCDGFGGFNWDEESSAYPFDPAFDFIYEVLCWIVFSNCLHFAFKKVVRIWADGIADPGREKVPMKFVPTI